MPTLILLTKNEFVSFCQLNKQLKKILTNYRRVSLGMIKNLWVCMESSIYKDSFCLCEKLQVVNCQEDEEAGREEQSSPTFDLYPQYCMAINSIVCLHFFHFCPDDNWSIQLKHQQVIFQTQVGNK